MEPQAKDLAADAFLGRHRKLVRRTALVSVLTLVSRILGFVREVLAATLFGDKSGIFDAFITAWRIPNLFRRFLGEGALSTALQTKLTGIDCDRGNAAGRQLLWATLRLVFAILLLVCGLVMFAAANLPDTFPGTDWRWLGADPAAVRELCVRLMPFVLAICLSALIGGALQVRGHFSTPALAPVALNLCWIASLCYVGWSFGWATDVSPELIGSPEEKARQLEMTRVLSWGVLLAGLVQLGIQIPAMARFGLLGAGSRSGAEAEGQALTKSEARSGARSVFARSAPLALGAAVYQVNVLMDGLMAESLLTDGGPSVHYFANRVQQFPLALIAVAATSAVFPALQAHGHRGEKAELRRLHDRTQLGVAFLALPATAGLLVLAGPIAGVLFQHGAFEESGVQRMGLGLAALALALLPAGAVGLTSRTYYSLGDFRTPVRISVAMLIANATLNVAFVRGAGMDVEGLALATVITSWGNLLLLLPGLKRLGLPSAESGWGGRLARSTVGALLCGLVAWGSYEVSSGGVQSGVRAAWSLCLAIAAGGGGFVLWAVLTGAPEWIHLKERLQARAERRRAN